MKAFELIDTPEKWSNKVLELSPFEATNGKKCAYLAILAAYGKYSGGDAIASKLRGILGVPSIVVWNDKNDWATVYGALKAHDI